MHFIKKFFQFICYFLIVAQPFYANAQVSKTIIKKIEFSAENKILISLDKVAEYRLFTLSKPDRLLIEIKNAELFKQDYLPQIPNFVSKITFHKKNETLIITLFFIEKYLAKNTNFDKKNMIIYSSLEPKNKKVIEPIKNTKNDIQKIPLPENKIENITVKNSIDKNKIKKNDEKEMSKNQKEDPKLIIKKTSNSIVKYKLREEKKAIQDDKNQISSVNIINDKKISQPIKKPVIVIDAGHGGKDPGTIGVFARTKEKNITLSYAKELAKHLMNEKKYKVYLTRDDDFFIPLDKRVAKSRRKKADLFISLHANSIADKNISGFSIYTLSDNSSDKQAELLAQKENQADIINGIDFSGASKDIMKTLIDLSQRESKNSSARFAKYVIRDIKKAEIEILQNTHRFAGFMVLTAPDMASVLIELGYLSNRREEEMLNSSSYRRLIAKTLTNSVNQYFKNFK